MTEKNFKVKDSGKRQEYKSGMRRDIQEDKPRYEFIWPEGLQRLAVHLAKGAKKYGDRNWQLANSDEEIQRFKGSAQRHFHQWVNGWDPEEDHMSAVIFNMFAAEYTKKKIEKAGKKVTPEW
jgi:hypothetical protein